MAYQPAILTLITVDGQMYHMRDSLYCNSLTVKEMIDHSPTVTSYYLPLTFVQLYFALRFLDTLQTPNSNEEWTNLIIGLEFLKITPTYHYIAIEMAKRYLNVISSNLTLEEVKAIMASPCCRIEKKKKHHGNDCTIL